MENTREEQHFDQNPKQKTVWSADKVIGISASVISLVACLVIVYQTYLMRQQQLLTVMPYITFFYNGGSHSDYFDYTIRNDGIGPAFIKEVNIYFKGEKQDVHDISTALYKLYPELNDFKGLAYSTVGPGRVIPANSEIKFLTMQGSLEASRKLLDITQRNKLLTIELVYASVYGERWKITSYSLSPEKL